MKTLDWKGPDTPHARVITPLEHENIFLSSQLGYAIGALEGLAKCSSLSQCDRIMEVLAKLNQPIPIPPGYNPQLTPFK